MTTQTVTPKLDKKLWAISALLGGAGVFGACLNLISDPWGTGLGFAAPVTAGRLAEHWWPTL